MIKHNTEMPNIALRFTICLKKLCYNQVSILCKKFTIFLKTHFLGAIIPKNFAPWHMIFFIPFNREVFKIHKKYHLEKMLLLWISCGATLKQFFFQNALHQCTMDF